MTGELTITGPGVVAHVRGRGQDPASVVIEGRLPGGPDVRALRGRVLLGTARVHPTIRGLLGSRRGSRPPA